MLTAPDIQAATSETLLSSASTALIHKAVLLDQFRLSKKNLPSVYPFNLNKESDRDAILNTFIFRT